MAESSLPWGGTTVGHATAAPYSADEWNDFMRDLFTYDRTAQGVIFSGMFAYTGNLAVSNPVGTTARVAGGMAMVDGCFYRNDANIDFACGTANEYYRIVLRKSTASQTVVATLLGPQAVTPPSVTQVDGTTWDISLATVFNNAGTLEITDTRQFVPYVNRQNISPNAVTYGSFVQGAACTLISRANVGIGGGFAYFANIPQSYKHLKITYSVKSAIEPDTGYTEDCLRMTFPDNVGTTILYDYFVWTYQSPLTYTETRDSGTGAFFVCQIPVNDSEIPRVFSSGEIIIPNYSSSTFNKGYTVHGGILTADRFAQYRGGGYTDYSDPILNIKISSCLATNLFFVENSTVSLYAYP